MQCHPQYSTNDGFSILPICDCVEDGIGTQVSPVGLRTTTILASNSLPGDMGIGEEWKLLNISPRRSLFESEPILIGQWPAVPLGYRQFLLRFGASVH
jgi:hypothetical protein